MTRKAPVIRKSKPTAVPIEAPPGTTRGQLLAQVVTKGVVISASTMVTYAQGSSGFEQLDINECVTELNAQIKTVQCGDLSNMEGLLVGQIGSLNAVFHELLRRAALNVGQSPEAMERYMRLAFKAQTQCRATVETLAEVKNPRSVAFVRQANIANGPQQVNNGTAAEQRAPPASRTSQNESGPIELLENINGEWLDTRAASQACRGDSTLETLGAGHGSAHESG